MTTIPALIVQYSAILVFLTRFYTFSADEVRNKVKFNKHPLLFYSADEVEGLQLKALSTHSRIANIIKNATKTILSRQDHYLPPKDYETFGSKWNEVYGNNLATLAFYCVLFPEDRNALSFTLKYMDIMVNLPKWQVISAPNDDVPVAHSLTGFTTAYDMLYPLLEEPKRELYLQKIIDVTNEFYEFAKLRWWGKIYLQNHVATNYLALIHGSLVASAHYPPALVWLEYAKESFEKTMKLLNHIVDGSLDEGVAYGSYTSRSVTQYIFLALRHFEIDHTNGFWIRQHFWFYYNTILPQFQRTVGIADSNNNWFYGPESQLVFIDAYVLKNGYGNWLAHEIREHRSKDKTAKLTPGDSQLYCTLHTEFIWYNSRLGRTVPLQSGKPDLHIFNDWGVVTYSHVSPKMETDTFLAFKSGKLHGRGMFDIVQREMYQSWFHGWKSLNPGHEHPDQNMFIFAPGGKLFITDGLYASKYSYLNNVWSFAPSPTSECFQPWEGQLGECGKWLGWRKPSASKYGGDLITASMNNGLVFTSGEAVQAYDSSMKLESVYRSLLLLNNQVLVILDHLKLKTDSPLSQFSTFFHNLVSSFEEHKFKDLSGVKIPTEDGDLQMFWVTDTGKSPKAKLALKPKDHTSQYQPGETNYVNVTMEFSHRRVRVAYVLIGHRASLTDFQFVESSTAGAKLLVKTTTESYDISIATDHSNPISRHQFLGYPGYASVNLGNGKLIHFGVNATSASDGTSDNDDSSVWFNTVNLSLGLTMSACVVLYLLKGRLRLKLHRRSKVVLSVIMLIWLLVVGQMAIRCSRSACFMMSTAPKRNFTGLGGSAGILPSIVITSLPGSGSELIGWLFYNNPDVSYVQAPSDIIRMPKTPKFKMNAFADACLWTYDDLSKHPQLKTWIQLLRQNLPTFVSDAIVDLSDYAQNEGANKRKNGVDVEYKEYTTQDLHHHVHKFPNAQTVMHFTSGSWGLKLPWLHGTLGNNLRAIHVVRDPRSWIATFLRNDMDLFKKLHVQEEVERMFRQADDDCIPNERYAEEYDKLRERLSVLINAPPHLLLAWLWSSNTKAVLRTVTSLPESNSRLVRFEDLVSNGENTANLVYKFIGFPLPPTMTHQLLQATHSDIYRIPYEGVISEGTVRRWQYELADYQIKDIEDICGTLMEKLGYQRMGPWRFKPDEDTSKENQ